MLFIASRKSDLVGLMLFKSAHIVSLKVSSDRLCFGLEKSWLVLIAQNVRHFFGSTFKCLLCFEWSNVPFRLSILICVLVECLWIRFDISKCLHLLCFFLPWEDGLYFLIYVIKFSAFFKTNTLTRSWKLSNHLLQKLCLDRTSFFCTKFRTFTFMNVSVPYD